jgi:hypothetical protein
MFSINVHIYFIQLYSIGNYLIAILTVLGNLRQLYIGYLEKFNYYIYRGGICLCDKEKRGSNWGDIILIRLALYILDLVYL